VNIVDSSAWLEYIDGGANAKVFAPAIEDVEQLVVPSIVIYEVYRRMLRDRGVKPALEAVGGMSQGIVVNLDTELALIAAALGLEHRLPLADSVIYAVARRMGATVWTQDEDFDGLDGVRYVKRGG
jgi:predicted nucleic acid-binding protein